MVVEEQAIQLYTVNSHSQSELRDLDGVPVVHGND